ncbi:glycosyltransferase family 61 protein [Pelagibacteraceae bacterium]|jgi:hypothetical protein|nr:glycosyltransferase family 61 protein [Pelagibacteraceae bacterium]
MLEYNYIKILINTIKKKLQLIFKEISYGIFKLLYGKIDKIESNSKDLKIIYSKFETNLNYKIYIAENSRIYTDTINDTAIINNNKILEGPSFQIRNTKFAKINENIIFSKGTPRIKRNLKGTVFSLLTGGSGNFNYWHWIFDVLPRIKILENSYDIKSIDYFLLPNLSKNYQKETLDLLQIPDKKRLSSIEYRHIVANKIISTSHPYVIRNDPSNEIQNIPIWITSWLRNSFLKENNFKDDSFPKKIYIDRSDAKSNHREFRKILNENDIIKNLQSEGYKIIRLADLHFKAQIKTFFNADKIIGLHGAGFANLIFCKPKTKILEIKPSTDGKVIENLARKFNLNFNSLSKEPLKFNYFGNMGHLEVKFQDIQKKFDI